MKRGAKNRGEGLGGKNHKDDLQRVEPGWIDRGKAPQVVNLSEGVTDQKIEKRCIKRRVPAELSRKKIHQLGEG